MLVRAGVERRERNLTYEVEMRRRGGQGTRSLASSSSLRGRSRNNLQLTGKPLPAWKKLFPAEHRELLLTRGRRSCLIRGGRGALSPLTPGAENIVSLRKLCPVQSGRPGRPCSSFKTPLPASFPLNQPETQKEACKCPS